MTNSSLRSNPVFWGLLATQFLGAFNDNYFKQMVLLKCSEMSRSTGVDLQPMAMAAFALPFVLLSGLGGFLSDRYSKRTVVVLCKVLEIIVMAAALQVLLLKNVGPVSQLKLLILVLAFMGAQSAFFGPSKYGILPELFSSRQLLPVNGAIQMTTFLAIIFGMAGAGIALDLLNDSLWFCSMVAVGIAVIGTGTSFLVRPTPVARPGLPLEVGNLFIPADVRQLFGNHSRLTRAILVMMMFWFIGGVTQPAVNNLGEHVFHMSKTRTSLMAASIGVGIAIGCVVSGFINVGSGDGHRWTTRGSYMLVGSLLFIAILATGRLGNPVQTAGTTSTPPVNSEAVIDGFGEASVTAEDVPDAGIWQSFLQTNLIEWILRGSMLLLGISAGVFVVPIQVYIQEAPPAELKGRMIGAMNLITWIGILLSAVFLYLVNLTTGLLTGGTGLEHQSIVFLILAVIMLPIAVLYRLPPPPDTDGSAVNFPIETPTA